MTEPANHAAAIRAIVSAGVRSGKDSRAILVDVARGVPAEVTCGEVLRAIQDELAMRLARQKRLDAELEALSQALAEKTAAQATEDGTLLPCPFCGGAGEPFEAHYSAADVRAEGWSRSTFFGVACADCGAAAQGIPGHATEAGAIRHWNLRAPRRD